jgi:hypothetical protein
VIRVTIDRVVVEGLGLSEKEIRRRLEEAFAGLDTTDEYEIARIVREAFDGR